jgi:hypothetical protein
LVSGSIQSRAKLGLPYGSYGIYSHCFSIMVTIQRKCYFDSDYRLFNHSFRSYSNFKKLINLSRLPCSESERGEMRPALWSAETTTWGAYFTGTKQTRVGKLSYG